MKTNKILYSLIIICTMSCSSSLKHEHYTLKPLNINLDNEKGVYDISTDITSSIDFVRLETNSKCLIGRLDKIIYQDNSYYILDNMNHAIYTFSSSGKHLSTLSHFGKGSDEYISISSFVVIEKNIWICDNVEKRVLCYDSNQNVIERISLKEKDFWVEDMTYKNGCIYFVNNWIGVNNKCYQLFVYDLKEKKGHFEKPFTPLKQTIYRGITNQIATADSISLVTFSYCDTIFQIKDMELIPKYKYIFSERMEDKPQSALYNSQKKDENIIHGISNIYQTKKSIILEFSDKKIPVRAFFNKKDSTCEIYKRLKISDLGNYNLTGITFYPNGIISTFNNAGEFKKYFEEYLLKKTFKNESYKKKLSIEISKIKEDDNPVLFNFTFNGKSNL